MIRLQDIQLNLGGATILDGVSFEVPQGGKAVLHGESGSGKTSLLRVMIGLHRPDTGRVEIAGQALSSDTITSIRTRLCYVPQRVSSFDEESALDFVMLPFQFRSNHAKRPDRERILNLMVRVGLDETLLKRQMGDLSGGEQQRLALTRALLLERDILLLDEATSAVDSDNCRRIMDLLFEDTSTTILAISHDPNWIKRADTRIELDHGSIVSADRKAQ